MNPESQATSTWPMRSARWANVVFGARDVAIEQYRDFRATKIFPSLDGLRALSIIAVIGFHVMHGHSALFRDGFLGVQLFFAISGILITTLLLRERDTAGEIGLYNFYVRRTLRIFPLYYLILGIYVVTTAVIEKGSMRGQTFNANLPAFLTYTSNWFVSLSGNASVIFYFAWSLATEEQFYLFWPSIVRFTRHRLIAIIAISLIMLAGEGVRRMGLSDHSGLGFRIISSFASSICLGCIAALVLHGQRGFTTIWRIAGQRWSAPLAATLLITFIIMKADSFLIDLSMVFLVITTVIRGSHPLRWLLENRVTRYIGTISYGMYLMHMLAYHVVIRILKDRAGEWVILLATIGVVVAAATISFYGFERKVQGLKKRLERKRSSLSRRSFPLPG